MNEKYNGKEKWFDFIFENKLSAIGLIIFIITPGIWTIFFFNRLEFWNMDVIKLLVISISMCAPVFSCCFLILLGCFIQARIDLDYEGMIIASALYSALIFAVVIFFKIVYPKAMTVEKALLVIIGSLGAFLIGNVMGVYKVTRK